MLKQTLILIFVSLAVARAYAGMLYPAPVSCDSAQYYAGDVIRCEMNAIKPAEAIVWLMDGKEVHRQAWTKDLHSVRLQAPEPTQAVSELVVRIHYLPGTGLRSHERSVSIFSREMKSTSSTTGGPPALPTGTRGYMLFFPHTPNSDWVPGQFVDILVDSKVIVSHVLLVSVGESTGKYKGSSVICVAVKPNEAQALAIALKKKNVAIAVYRAEPVQPVSNEVPSPRIRL